jgi:hypothetical protein
VIWLDDGEVVWPYTSAGEAVDGLADAGLVVLGVDPRERNDAGYGYRGPGWQRQPIGRIGTGLNAVGNQL